MSTHFWPAETAAVVAAAEGIRSAVAAVSAELGGAMDRYGIRVSYDSRERVILLALVRDDGHSLPLVAIPADPGAADHGRPGVPQGVPLYGPPIGGVAN